MELSEKEIEKIVKKEIIKKWNKIKDILEEHQGHLPSVQKLDEIIKGE